MITAAPQIDLMPGANFLMVEADPRADVSHGVAAAALGTKVGLAPMDESTIMQTRMVRIEETRHGRGGIKLIPLDLGIEDICGQIDGFGGGIAIERARDDLHAAILRGGRIDGQPYRDHLHGVEHPAPVRRIFVPRDPFAVAFRLADEMTRK